LQGCTFAATAAEHPPSGIETVWVADPAVLGAVVSDLRTDSINVATSLCGPMQAVAVDRSLLAAAEGAGLPVLADVRRHEDHSPYNAKDGRLFWHDGKPCVSYRYLLWESKRANAP